MPFARPVLERTIELALMSRDSLIRAHGNYVQLPAQGPYRLVNMGGLYVGLHSNQHQHQHLTYADIRSVMQGLLDVLITQHNYYAAGFEIYEIGRGRIGGGNIGRLGW